MAKEKSVPAQTSKDAQKDSLATTEVIVLVATIRGDSQIRMAGGLVRVLQAAWKACITHLAACHPQPA
jgi:hypothetical protein